jgi:hypothetical protein
MLAGLAAGSLALAACDVGSQQVLDPTPSQGASNLGSPEWCAKAKAFTPDQLKSLSLQELDAAASCLLTKPRG